MKITYFKLALIFVLFSCAMGLFLNNKPTCETTVQNPSKYGCTDSQIYCRACCHFDLRAKNTALGENYLYLKAATLIAESNYCTCEFCRNSQLEDFSNKAFFKK